MKDNFGITLYSYDDLDRLTGVNSPDRTAARYVYDAVGNRLELVQSRRTINYTYDKANRLLHAGTTIYTWDNNGNQTQKRSGGITDYTYDHLNRLSSIVLPDGTTKRFAYYPDGRRLSTSDQTEGTIYHFYDGLNELAEGRQQWDDCRPVYQWAAGRSVD